jgi:hypothetical protein
VKSASSHFSLEKFRFGFGKLRKGFEPPAAIRGMKYDMTARGWFITAVAGTGGCPEVQLVIPQNYELHCLDVCLQPTLGTCTISIKYLISTK